MKISKKKLENIINEEIQNVLKEQNKFTRAMKKAVTDNPVTKLVKKHPVVKGISKLMSKEEPKQGYNFPPDADSITKEMVEKAKVLQKKFPYTYMVVNRIEKAHPANYTFKDGTTLNDFQKKQIEGKQFSNQWVKYADEMYYPEGCPEDFKACPSLAKMEKLYGEGGLSDIHKGEAMIMSNFFQKRD